jgi:hypothetical protein
MGDSSRGSQCPGRPCETQCDVDDDLEVISSSGSDVSIPEPELMTVDSMYNDVSDMNLVSISWRAVQNKYTMQLQEGVSNLNIDCATFLSTIESSKRNPENEVVHPTLVSNYVAIVRTYRSPQKPFQAIAKAEEEGEKGKEKSVSLD